jgi:hypothetical protein
MHAAATQAAPWKRDIECLFGKARREPCLGKRGAARFKRRLDTLFRRVIGGAGRLSFFRRKRREVASEAGEFSGFSEVACFCVLERGRVGCRAEIRKRAFDDGFERANGLLWL